MSKKIVAMVVVAVLAVAGLAYWLAGRNDPKGADGGEAGVVASGADGMVGGRVDPATLVTGLESMPASLRDTEVDGELEVDAAGRLKITNGIRRMFDYFLSATGEESLETILARIRAYIRLKLPSGPAAEAERLLDAYIAYKKGLDGIQQVAPPSSGQMDLQAVRYQMQQVSALRTRYFSPEVITAFFGDEDAYDQYTLSRLDILQNRQLTPAVRAEQLAALEQQLPPALQESMKAINQYQNLQALTEDWQKRSGSPAELRQIRENLVGAEAADRLENLDRERTQWSQRINAWLVERSAILSNAALGQQDREAQVVATRQQRFDATEILRVESLERMHDRGERLP
ncbi:MAG: lipase secretion chaperone [Gammaproteobacteria bacterium]